MAAMAAANAEFLGAVPVWAARARWLARGRRPCAPWLCSTRRTLESAAAPVKKAAGKAASAVKKANTKVNVPSNEELAKWYGKYWRVALQFGPCGL